MADSGVVTGTNLWLDWQQSLLNETSANLRRWGRLPFLWQQAQRVQKGVTPSEVVYEEDRLKLRRYIPKGPIRYRTPLVFVFALVNRPYILDLRKGRSVVSHFVDRGFDTYLVDWGEPTRADRHLTIDDYVNGYISNVVDHIRERTRSPQVSVLGYCMGGTLSTMFTALHQERVKNLILMAAGINFDTEDGLLNLWCDPKYFDVDRFVDTYGNVPAEFLQTMFQMLKPVQNIVEKPIGLAERMDDEDFVDDYFAMEGWLNDNIPVPGEVFREFVKYLYQKNLLVKNQMPVGRHIVDLRDITCPVLNLMAKKDDLVPCSQSLPFNDLVSSKDRKAIEIPAGHIGLAVGSKAQRELWPQVCDWLGKRSEPRPKAR
ncbi:MAG TPA: class III poly(R)-hydroxyalkanoic acid synthase subunit PhaC [Tepidisphaeraceae bacterium]|jgi:polyhydroxyalkanoate synthase|nr:class III poly(R)-hydroxyalkanoic acid synthase subunit PhaC [Tepidisphaeraceae bacterium]